MPALVITTEGDVKPASVPSDQSAHLAWMYEQISCSTVDVVGMPHDLDFWIDDEGLITGKPVNVIATLWARYFGGLDVTLHGDVILAKHDSRGNTVDPSDREAVAFMVTMEKVLDMAVESLPDVAVIEMPDISLN